MHILFLSHNFPPEVNALATRTYEHCVRWVADGHRVTVVACAPNYPRGVVFEGYRNAWRSEEMMQGIRVVRVGTLLAPNEGFFRRTIYFLSYMVRAALFGITLRDVDVVVSSSPQFFGGWAGVLCKWIRRWPFVLEIRDIWPESIVAVGAMKRSRLFQFLEWLEHRMYAAADHIVTVGDGYKRQLVERGVPESMISVVPNGVDTSGRWTLANPNSIRQQYNSTSKFVCAYIGTVGMAHGLEVIVEAATKLQQQGRSDVQFWIVGDGAERAKLQTEAQRRGLENVVFTGMVLKDRVGSFVAAADASLVHLRGTELFGTVIPSKIFEIMDAEVPIIMGVRGEARDIVVNNGAGVDMIPDDSDSLIQGIELIVANPSAYRQGRQFVTQNYNRDDLAGRMLAVLKRFGTTDVNPSVHTLNAGQANENDSRKSRKAA
jgi:glycosyltransferase involved in cell wall biosynthesis